MRASLNSFALTLACLFDISTPHPCDCPSNTWLNLTSLPSPRQEHSTVALNDTTIAVIGGAAPIGGSAPVTTNLMQFYDIPSDKWRTVTPAPFKVKLPNVAVDEGKIYLLGGLVVASERGDVVVNWTASGECHVYDSKTDAWSALAPMPSGTERGSAVTGVYRDVIYLAGGMTVLQNGYQDAVITVTAFNMTSGSWQRLPELAANLPQGRQHAMGAVVGNIFYLVGGRWFSQLEVRGTVFELNLTNTAAGWKTSKARMPVALGGLSGDAVGHKIYAFGGEGNPNTITGVFNQSEVFDTQKQQWNKVMPMPVPRHGTHAAAVGKKIYIPGGGLQQDGKAVTLNGATTYGNPSAHFDAYCV